MERTRFFLIFAAVIAALTLFGCQAGDDGKGGAAGDPGKDGADGEPGVGLTTIDPPTLFGHTQHSVVVAYDIEAAYNGDTFFWRLTFDAPEGKRHDYYRYTNGAWQVEGGDTRDAQATIDNDVDQGSTDVNSTIYETRTSIMLSDPGALTADDFATADCFVTCHNESRHQPEWTDANGEDTKYVALADATGAVQNDPVLDMWHWRGARSNPIAMSDDQYIQAKTPAVTTGDDGGRKGDAGTGPFATNTLVGGNPSFVFNPTTTAEMAFAFNWKDFWDSPMYYITSAAARVVNKSMTWAAALTAGYWPMEGDVVPKRLLQDATLSHANITATGTFFTPDPTGATWMDDRLGTWEVQLQRPLATTNVDDFDLVALGTYNVAFEMHTWRYTTRDHYVSFPMTLGLGVAANIQAYNCATAGDCAANGATPPTWANSTAVRIYLFQPGITTWEFLTGNNTGKIYTDPVTGSAVNQDHGGSGSLPGTACTACHRVRDSDPGGASGSMETLAGQRGGIFAATPHE